MIKNILKVLLITVVFLGLAFVGLIYLVKPNQFRPAIEQAVLDSTGYQLQIAGDLDLQFRPYIGLTLRDVRLRNPASPQELASTTSVSLRVDPSLLLQGELLISELRADDFHINVYTSADGVNIWDLEGAGGSRPAPASSGDSGPINASFERILVNNASIDIQDLAAGTRYSIDKLNLEGRNVRLDGQAFPVETTFMFLNNGITTPLAAGLRSDVAIDTERGDLTLDNLSFNLTPMLLQGEIAVTGLNTSPQFNASFESNAFDIVGLLQTLGIMSTTDELAVPAIGSRPPLTLAWQVSGDQSSISIPSLTATLGASELQANADVRMATDFMPLNISYTAISNGIDLTPFMTPPTAPVADTPAADPAIDTMPEPAPEPAADIALPLALLNSLNLLGSLSVESITAGDLVLEDVNVFTNIEDGVLDIETQPITAYSGSILGNLRLDARGDIGALTSHLSLSQLNIADMTPEVSRLNAVTGRLDVEADFTATGTSTNDLLNSLSGATTFAVTENSVDIGVIKQVFTAIAALGTTSEAIQQWPDVIRFQEMVGYILLDNGLSADQQVKVRMDNFDITGTGGLDLAAETFDYDLLFTVLGAPFVQTIQISPRYHDVSWPVECSSAFDDSVNQYCRPDFAQVRQIFNQMGTIEARRRLDEVISDQVPEQLQDSARRLLPNLFN